MASLAENRHVDLGKRIQQGLVVTFVLGMASCSKQTATTTGGRLAFVSATDENTEIYAINADGSHLQRLTTHEAPDFNPAWSPDGKQIAISSLRDADYTKGRFMSRWDKNCEIYVMNADGSQARRLTYNESCDETPVWSPDGKRIAFISFRNDRNTDISIVDVSSAQVKKLTDSPAWKYAPAWSPDGSRIAFRSSGDGSREGKFNYDIYTVEVESSQVRRLTTDEGGDYEPRWSPDGMKIAFVAEREGKRNIYLMGTDESQAKKLVQTEFGDYSMMNIPYGFDFDWSLDGRRIAFTSDKDGNWQVYTMNADGSQVRQLTHRMRGAGSPAWSPDGNWIAFTSLATARTYDIYIMTAGGSHVKRLASGSEVAWSPLVEDSP